MSNFIFICEGTSEKYLVERVLVPYWKQKGVQITPATILLGSGNSENNGAGGNVTFERLETDLLSALNSDANNSYFTTIFDLYELHGDWPGKDLNNPVIIENLEKETKEKLEGEDSRLTGRFFPYFMLHEYEALLFTRPDAITEITKARDATPELQKILQDFQNNPEDINTQLSPSRRLSKAKANYGKTVHSHRIMLEIGIDCVRERCPHFNAWMTLLENHQ